MNENLSARMNAKRERYSTFTQHGFGTSMYFSLKESEKKSLRKLSDANSKNILVINASPKIEESDSRNLSNFLIEKWASQFKSDNVVYRDVGKNPIPHFTSSSIDAIESPKGTSTASQSTRLLCQELIAEIKAADTIVISLPMYNGSIPSGLKAYFDHIAVKDLTWGGVKYGENKNVIVITTGGGNYVGTQNDFVTPYIKFFLGTIDLKNVKFIHAHKLCFGDETKASSLNAAKAELTAYIAETTQVRKIGQLQEALVIQNTL